MLDTTGLANRYAHRVSSVACNHGDYCDYEDEPQLNSVSENTQF